MTGIFHLTAVALLVSLAGLGACPWALRRARREDLDRPARRILYDNAQPPLRDSPA
jgi:cbb3-type cytochrome oxidase maturation protein